MNAHAPQLVKEIVRKFANAHQTLPRPTLQIGLQVALADCTEAAEFDRRLPNMDQMRDLVSATSPCQASPSAVGPIGSKLRARSDALQGCHYTGRRESAWSVS